MKKLLYCLGIFAVVIVTAGLLYYRYFSITSVLSNEDFTKNDIVLIQEYTAYPEELINIFLLADSEKIGLVFAKKNKYGLWDVNSSSIAINPSDEDLITLGFGIFANESDLINSDSHIFVSYYLDNKEEFKVISPDDYHLDVEFFPINNRVLLVAHAISNSDISSEDVVSYLESYYK